MATRRKRKTNVDTKAKVDEARSRLRDLAVEQEAQNKSIAVVEAQLAASAVEAKALMEFLKIEEFDVPGVGTHELKPGRTNAKNTVRPKEFKELAGDNAFWAVCTVPIGEAKKHLGEKELGSVTTTIPGGETDPKYSFK